MPVLFGEDHPYGRSIEDPELLEQLDREGIKGFYDEHYLRKGGISIILSGLTEPWMVEKLDEELGHIPIEGADREPFQVDPPRPSAERTHWVNKEGALQASMRIGKPLFSRQHPDFPGMVILTTLLGGYFGSRLMMNLREDKGYTYGVGAASIALQDSGFFAIATDVGGQVREAALEEALKEIRALSEKPVTHEELEHVRYYMQGSFLRSADGPFARAELFKRVHASGLDLSFYDRLMETLHTITPERLQELAREHLKEEEMRVVIAGDPSAPGS
jgi:predicted Zn-dependent peptidase